MAYEEHLQRQTQRRSELQSTVQSLLADQKSLTLEIGSGHGHYLTAYAQEHPDEFCLGIDIIQDRVRRSNKKAQDAQLSNVHFIVAEATMLLEVLPQDIIIDKLFILFPDPWPKKRHFKNRLIQTAFLDTLAKLLPLQTKLYFRTDYEGYFDWTLEHLNDHPKWSILQDEPWPFEAYTVFQEKMGKYQSVIAQLTQR